MMLPLALTHLLYYCSYFPSKLHWHAFILGSLLITGESTLVVYRGTSRNRSVPKMSQKFPKNCAWDTFGSHPNIVWDIYGTCLGGLEGTQVGNGPKKQDFWGAFGTCLGHVLGRVWVKVEHFWDFPKILCFGICPKNGFLRSTWDILLGTVRDTLGVYPERFPLGISQIWVSIPFKGYRYPLGYRIGRPIQKGCWDTFGVYLEWM
jgi:hypothetical protein